MDDLLREYLPILIFLGLAVALGLILVIAALVLAVRRLSCDSVVGDTKVTQGVLCAWTNSWTSARQD